MNQVSPKSYAIPRCTLTRRSVITRPSLATASYSATFTQRPVQQVSKNPNVVAVTASRQKEKNELIVLNDKFASLIERVRFLESQNKKLRLELAPLTRSNHSSKLAEIYEAEIEQMKSLSGELTTERDHGQVRATQLVNKAKELKEKLAEAMSGHEKSRQRIAELSRSVSANETEISLVKRRVDELETEARHYRKEAQFLLGEIQHFNVELDTETGLRLQLENETAGLEEELTFMRQLHEQELENVRETVFKDVGLEAGSFFKSELAKYIRQLRGEYEENCSRQKGEMEQWYRLRVQESQRCLRGLQDTEGLKLRLSEQSRENGVARACAAEREARVAELERLIEREREEGGEMLAEKGAELDGLTERRRAVLEEYEAVVRMKTSLEVEIGTYRRLLEGGEDCEGLRQVVDAMSGVQGRRLSQDGVLRSIRRTTGTKFVVN